MKQTPPNRPNFTQKITLLGACGFIAGLAGCSALPHGPQNIRLSEFDDAPAGAAPPTAPSDPNTASKAVANRGHRNSNAGAGIGLPTITADVVPSQPTVTVAAPPAGHAMPVDALLGAVNGHPVFVSEILRPIAAQLRRAASRSGSRAGFTRRAQAAVFAQLQRRMNNMLVLTAARNRLSKQERKFLTIFVAKQKAKIVSQYRGSAALADRALRLRGGSLEKTLRQKRKHEMVALYLQTRLYPKILVTRREIADYYRHHLKHFTKRAYVNLYSITYPVIRQWPRDPDDPKHREPVDHATKAQIRQARHQAMAYMTGLEAKLKAHKVGFAETAEEISSDSQADNGGHWPRIHRGELRNKLVNKVVFGLAPHTMAPPLLLKDKRDPRRDMVMIIRVGDAEPRRVVPFSIAQKTIGSKLRREQYERLAARYYGKLHGRAGFDALNGMLAIATRIAVSRYYTGRVRD